MTIRGEYVSLLQNARTSFLKLQVHYERDVTDPIPMDDARLDGILQKQLEPRGTNNLKEPIQISAN